MARHFIAFLLGLSVLAAGCRLDSKPVPKPGGGPPPPVPVGTPATTQFLAVNAVPPTAAAKVQVSGTAGPNTKAIRVTGGKQPVVLGVRDDGTFSATDTSGSGGGDARVELKTNRVNHLFFTELDEDFDEGFVVPLDVIQDTEAPQVSIDFPPNGAVLATQTINVSGRVKDRLSGFMGLTVEVFKDGLSLGNAIVDVGIGTNGTFDLANVALNTSGNTVLSVKATDILGNTVTTSDITMSYAAPTGFKMEKLSGGNESAKAGEWLASPIRVRVLQANNQPFVGKVVNFTVTKSDGVLYSQANPNDPKLAKRMFQVVTDASGIAQAYWRMGMDAGCGNNRVKVSSKDIAGQIFFCASGLPNDPKQINVGVGGNQVATVDGPAPCPLTVWVNDGCNGVQGVDVTFLIEQGGGVISGNNVNYFSDVVTVRTSDTGHAQAYFAAGANPGNNVISANFAVNQGDPAYFNVLGKANNEPVATFSGQVLTNSRQPVQGASINLKVGLLTDLTVTTDPDGCFLFDLVEEFGPAELEVKGSTATHVGGVPLNPSTERYPDLHYETVVLKKTANALTNVVLLPVLDPTNDVLYDGTQDVELMVQGIEGLKMIVRAGSAKHPDGSVPSSGNPMTLSLNQVHYDDIPMAMPDGAAPPFSWTFQPAGATYDPPVEVNYPNMSGLAPGAAAFFLSFDHDTNKFEIVGTGSVTPDGSTIVSDPGSGLTKGGWGCNCPPYSVTADCANCETDCQDSGQLSGGSVAVSNPMPALDDAITFTASGVTDSGGTKVEECDDGTSETISVSPGSVLYTYTVTTPTGTVISGSGASVTVEATECGTYTASFQASVERDCPPGSITLPSATVEVDDETLITTEMKMKTTDFTWAQAVLAEFESIASGGTQNGPCVVTPSSGNLTAMAEINKYQQCCMEGGGVVVKEFYEVKGSLGPLNLGRVDCSWSYTSVNGLTTLNLNLFATAGLNVAIDDKQDCDDDQICGSLQLNALVGGKVDGSVGPGGILGSLKARFLVIGVNGNGQICYDPDTDTFDANAGVAANQGLIVGSYTQLGTFFEQSFSVPVFNSWSSGTVTP